MHTLGCVSCLGPRDYTPGCRAGGFIPGEKEWKGKGGSFRGTPICLSWLALGSGGVGGSRP